MNPFKLSKFAPGLQIQLFLSTLFRLKTILDSVSLSSSVLIKMEEPDSPWLENMGILQQLKLQVAHLLTAYPGSRLLELKAAIECAIEKCQQEGELDRVKGTSWSQNLFQLTAEFITAYEPDENLYYFLLRHQEECKNSFGEIFLVNLFQKKHHGLKETEQFLVNKYQERGFFHLKGRIKKHLAGLSQC